MNKPVDELSTSELVDELINRFKETNGIEFCSYEQCSSLLAYIHVASQLGEIGQQLKKD